jgi:CRP/FNR family cyclic AMP-dependent transcriptional regulator
MMTFQPRSWERHAVVLRQGKRTDAFFALLTGRAKVLIAHPDGSEIKLAVIRAGEFFGEMGLIDGALRAATVQPLDHCETRRLPRHGVERLLTNNFSLVMKIAHGLVARLRAADRSIASLALMDVYGRVARLVLDQAEPSPQSTLEMIALSQREIVRMVGASREMVGRILRDPQQRGLVRIERRRIMLVGGMARGLLAQARR